MSIETYTEKDLHNITTLSNAIKVRRVYEDARLAHPTAKKISITHGEDRMVADETIAQVVRGMEVGARTELFDAGHHTTVHEVYAAQQRKETPNGE